MSSISVQIPKALVYGGDPRAWIYLNLPTISGLSGAGAVALAIAAFRSSKRPTKAVVIGLAVGVDAFVALMVLVAVVMVPHAPPALPSQEALVGVSLAFMLSPPAIGALASLLALAAMLLWLRGISGRRPAFAGLIMGCVPLVYWLLSLLIGASGGSE
jgi:hypothetical protein